MIFKSGRFSDDTWSCRSSPSLKEVIFLCLLWVTFFWLIFTIFTWVCPMDGKPDTLVHVVRDQMSFVRSLAHRIW
jgi:hypothetical protein